MTERYDLTKEPVFALEIEADSLLEIMPGSPTFQPFARFPSVIRDISLIVDKQIESDRVRELAESSGEGLVESVHLFDLYAGEKVAPSEKVLNFRICYRSKDKTLDGQEINRLHEAIIDRIREETGGRLREG